MICGWVQDRLLLYLSGELGSQETLRLLRHLEKCARCTAMAEQIAETQATLSPLLRTAIQAPPTLDARVMDAVRSFPSGRRPWYLFPSVLDWKRRVALVGAMLGFFFAGYLFGLWQTGQNQGIVLSSWGKKPVLELAAVQTLSTTNSIPLHFPRPDPHLVALGLKSRVKFSVAPVDLQAEGATLRGGRECRLQEIPVAFFQYDFRGERISLLQIDHNRMALPVCLPPSDHGTCYLVTQMGEMTCILWCHRNINFVMVARITPEQLLRLASRAQALLGGSG